MHLENRLFWKNRNYEVWLAPSPLLPLPSPNISLQNVSLAIHHRNDSALILSKTFARIQIGDSCGEKKNALLFICINTSWDF